VEEHESLPRFYTKVKNAREGDSMNLGYESKLLNLHLHPKEPYTPMRPS